MRDHSEANSRTMRGLTPPVKHMPTAEIAERVDYLRKWLDSPEFPEHGMIDWRDYGRMKREYEMLSRILNTRTRGGNPNPD